MTGFLTNRISVYTNLYGKIVYVTENNGPCNKDSDREFEGEADFAFDCSLLFRWGQLSVLSSIQHHRNSDIAWYE